MTTTTPRYPALTAIREAYMADEPQQQAARRQVIEAEGGILGMRPVMEAARARWDHVYRPRLLAADPDLAQQIARELRAADAGEEFDRDAWWIRLYEAVFRHRELFVGRLSDPKAHRRQRTAIAPLWEADYLPPAHPR